MNRYSVFTMLYLVSLSAAASEWEFIGGTDKGFTALDFSSVAVEGIYRKAWIQEDYLSPMKSAEGSKTEFQSVNLLYYFDCKARKSGFVKLIAYEKAGAEGRVVASSTTPFSPKELSDIVPDTEAELTLNIVCSTLEERNKRKASARLSVPAMIKIINKAVPQGK